MAFTTYVWLCFIIFILNKKKPEKLWYIFIFYFFVLWNKTTMMTNWRFVKIKGWTNCPWRCLQAWVCKSWRLLSAPSQFRPDLSFQSEFPDPPRSPPSCSPACRWQTESRIYRGTYLHIYNTIKICFKCQSSSIKNVVASANLVRH